MEEDSKQVLKFMASNGLIANPKKIAMLFLNTNTFSVVHNSKLNKLFLCKSALIIVYTLKL